VNNTNNANNVNGVNNVKAVSGALLLEVKALSHSYSGPNGRVPVLTELDLQVRRGEFVAVLGKSGCGKSTLLNLIGGLEKPDSGEIRVAGQDITLLSRLALEVYRQRSVSFIFQFYNLLPALTARENVMLALEAAGEPSPDALARVIRELESVGLGDKMDNFPSQLSGGEQQRVAIARALVRQAPLILADEPTGNLDEDTSAQILELLVNVQRKSGTTLLLITHDDKVAARADRLLRLSRGQIDGEVRLGAAA
jgi:ABC-type lipoprotein export system ATPase subunit